MTKFVLNKIVTLASHQCLTGARAYLYIVLRGVRCSHSQQNFRIENLKHDLTSNCKFRTINLTLNPAEFSFPTLKLRQRISSLQKSTTTTTTTTTSRERLYIQSHQTLLKLSKLTMLKPCKTLWNPGTD